MLQKKISVIMGIYNCEKTLGKSIESILEQTYSNWELIMCDDGSEDQTADVAQRYVEKYSNKMILLRNEKNMGLNYTLNKCLHNSSGEYIARMDGDDISYKRRFEKEIQVLDEREDIAIVSTDMEFFDENGVRGRTHVKKSPQKYDFLKGTPFCHAACMVRREAYMAVGGYSVDSKFLRVEDYHLWIKMYEKGYRGMNIQEPLYQMRDDNNAQARRKFKYRLNESYVKAYGVKNLRLPIYGYIYCLRPILVGLLPSHIYKIVHRKNS